MRAASWLCPLSLFLQGTSNVLVFSPDGRMQRAFGDKQLANPYGICTNDPYTTSRSQAIVIDMTKVRRCRAS
jgi:hypothetical protein